MEFISTLLDFILNIDQHLVIILNDYQTWTYLILFLIIFSETGFVVLPFLPGDSLLFAVGALIAKGGTGLDLYLMIILLTIAAILGNTVNYYLGSYFGKKVFKEGNRVLKLEYYEKTQVFFQKYGARAIILSRFLPIFRTIAPFVAGVGRMPLGTYTLYNVVGGISWILGFLVLGFFFGNFTIVKENFALVVLFIIAISFMPVIFAVVKSRIRK